MAKEIEKNGGKLYTIEIDEERYNLAQENFKKSGLNNIVSIKGDAVEEIKKIDENLRELLKLKEELELKKENIRYFEHFSDYEIPRIKYYPKRYILLKNGKFKDENEINLELKKLKRKSEEWNQ